jgi:hypothetical protein
MRQARPDACSRRSGCVAADHLGNDFGRVSSKACDANAQTVSHMTKQHVLCT